MLLLLLALGLPVDAPAPRSPPPPIEYAHPIPYAHPYDNVRTLVAPNFIDCSSDDVVWVYDVVTVEVRIHDSPAVWRLVGTIHRSQQSPDWVPYWESDYYCDWHQADWRDGQPCRCRAVPADRRRPATFGSLDEALRFLL